jgi:hypothetical protein
MWWLRMPRRVQASTVTYGVLGLMAVAGSPSSGAAVLPDGRAYELVSPAGEKNGADILPDSQRTRAASNGDAVAYSSLKAFGDAVGTGVATDYVSVRSENPNPGSSGWSTHAVTPPQDPLSINGVLSDDPLYVGDFSPDLRRGVFSAWSPVTDDPNVAATANLYARDDLLTLGDGRYRLVTPCPLCDLTGTPLPPLSRPRFVPFYAGASDDFEHIAFESQVQLTPDAPSSAGPRVYQWDQGTLSFAGYIPAGADASCGGTGPTCIASPASLAGMGGTAGLGFRPVHVMSSDGNRLFITVPTTTDGDVSPFGFRGRLYVRTANSVTDEITASERTDCAGDPTCGGDGLPDPSPDGYQVARFWAASADGARVFFTTGQALTDDAPPVGNQKIYMYDASQPASDPHNLTFVSADAEPADGENDVQGIIDTSDNGRYVYFVTTGQLISGGPADVDRGIYMWHDGTIAFIGKMLVDETGELMTTGASFTLFYPQTRATPDGRFLVLSSHDGTGFATGHDHGVCPTSFGVGCRELYVYDAQTQTLECASCNPSGAPATASAATGLAASSGASTTWHLNRAITTDGKRVFFTSAEPLVIEDVNGKQDVYEYDTSENSVHLISSGTDASNSYFLDASSTGNDVFFITRERLIGWDIDTSYDLYDARVAGGFSEPKPSPPDCSGSACQVTPGLPPGAEQLASASIGGGDLVPHLKHSSKRPCRKGRARMKVNGKRRCTRLKRQRAKRGNNRKGGRKA